MPRYITAQQYRSRTDGIIDLSGTALTDTQLNNFIHRAEAEIDSAVGFSLLAPQGFAAGVIGQVQGGFDMKTRRFRFPLGPVPVRQITRIQVHISNTGVGGAPLLAQLSPADVVINQWDQYLEIVALTLTYSMTSVVWQLGLNPPIMEVDMETGFFLPAAGEVLSNDSGDLKTYRALRGFWASVYTQAITNQPAVLPAVPPVVYKNGAKLAGTSLTTALVAGTAYTSLAVNALPAAVAPNATLTLSSPTSALTTTVTATAAGAAAGATSIPISSFTPTAAWPLGTYVAAGFQVNFAEGQVLFGSANVGTDLIAADYTYTIPDEVMDAAIAQTTWRLALRQVTQMGALPYDLVRSGEQQVRRKEANAVGRSALCTEALSCIEKYISVPIA